MRPGPLRPSPPRPALPAAVLAAFKEQEALLYEQLSGLCRDASWLKSYMVAALVAGKDAFQVG